jgi:hypothetical protein
MLAQRDHAQFARSHRQLHTLARTAAAAPAEWVVDIAQSVAALARSASDEYARTFLVDPSIGAYMPLRHVTPALETLELLALGRWTALVAMLVARPATASRMVIDALLTDAHLAVLETSVATRAAVARTRELRVALTVAGWPRTAPLHLFAALERLTMVVCVDARAPAFTPHPLFGDERAWRDLPQSLLRFELVWGGVTGAALAAATHFAEPAPLPETVAAELWRCLALLPAALTHLAVGCVLVRPCHDDLAAPGELPFPGRRPVLLAPPALPRLTALRHLDLRAMRPTVNAQWRDLRALSRARIHASRRSRSVRSAQRASVSASTTTAPTGGFFPHSGRWRPASAAARRCTRCCTRCRVCDARCSAAATTGSS